MRMAELVGMEFRLSNTKGAFAVGPVSGSGGSVVFGIGLV